MGLIEDIKNLPFVKGDNLKVNKDTYELKILLAERKALLTKQKLEYFAKFKIDDCDKILHFTEMLKETGAGISSGGIEDISPGFSIQKETYKIDATGRKGSIEEQSSLLGQKYEYKFDWRNIRENIETIAKNNGYKFDYIVGAIRT